MRFIAVLAVVFLCKGAHSFVPHEIDRKSKPFINDSLHPIDEQIPRSIIGRSTFMGPRFATKQARVDDDDDDDDDGLEDKTRVKVDSVKDSDDESSEDDNRNVYSDELGTYKAGELLPVEVVKRWLDEGTLKKIPSIVFDLNSRDRTAQAKGDNERQEFFLGTFTELIEDPSNMRPPTGKDEYRYKDGRVEVRAAASRLGRVRYHLPTVYFCHKNGFIVACGIKVGKLTKMKMESILAGKTEVLGKVNGIHCTRSYSIFAAHEHPREGYLMVDVSTELCNGTKKKLYVHNLCLVTFKGARPPGHVGQHIGERSDNRIENLHWIPGSEKMMRNRNKRLAPTPYTMSTLPRDTTYYSSELHDWWANARYPHLLLSGDGTHVYNKDTGKYLPIEKMTFRKTGKVEFCILVKLEGKPRRVPYCRFAMESFIGDKLSSGAKRDQVDQYHEPNSCENHQGDRENGSILGVYRRKYVNKAVLDLSWVVMFRIWTPDGPTGSIEASKHFLIREHGYEKARRLAMAYRRKHTRKEGMNYECVRVVPTVRKTFS